MTEKRFYIQCDEYNAWSVWEKDKDFVVFDLLEYDAEVVCKALNELSDENEQLQLDNKRLLSDYTDVCNENIALEEENEQLKKELNLEKVQLILQKRYNDVKREIKQNRQVSMSEREFVTRVCADEKAYLLEQISEELGVDLE